jgi:hypothetical protein
MNGMSAADFKKLKERNEPEAVKEHIHGCLFKQY